MIKPTYLLVALAAVVLLTYNVNSEESKKKFSAVCPVSGKAAIETSAADYKGGQVYFCCENCPKAFAKNSEKYAAKANHQLVSTGQAKQVKCPIAGRPVNEAHSVSIAKVEVGFCCPNCKGKVEKAEGDAQIDLVFNDAAFKKGFEVAKKTK